MRLNLREQAREWRIRGMRDVADISASFMRSGAVFVTVAIISCTLLAANAASAPLARAWSNWDDDLLEVRQSPSIAGWAVSPATARGPNVLFTPSQTIRDFWQSSAKRCSARASATASGGAGAVRPTTRSTAASWQQLDRQARLVEAGSSFLGGTAEEVARGPAV